MHSSKLKSFKIQIFASCAKISVSKITRYTVIDMLWEEPYMAPHTLVIWGTI